MTTLDRLTPRQRTIAGLVAEGYDNAEIARRCGITLTAVGGTYDEVRARPRQAARDIAFRFAVIFPVSLAIVLIVQKVW